MRHSGMHFINENSSVQRVFECSDEVRSGSQVSRNPGTWLHRFLHSSKDDYLLEK